MGARRVGDSFDRKSVPLFGQGRAGVVTAGGGGSVAVQDCSVDGMCTLVFLLCPPVPCQKPPWHSGGGKAAFWVVFHFT